MARTMRSGNCALCTSPRPPSSHRLSGRVCSNGSQQRTQVVNLAGDHVQALQRAIELALSVNNGLVALVCQGQGHVPQFEEIGTQVLPLYPGIAAMGFSLGGGVQQAVPLRENEGLVAFNQPYDRLQRAESERARESGQLTLEGPMELVQAGLGVVGRQLVYLEDKCAGAHRACRGRSLGSAGDDGPTSRSGSASIDG